MSPDDLDETIEESFPASDAPANTPETGIGIAVGDEDGRDSEAESQYSEKASSGKQ